MYLQNIIQNINIIKEKTNRKIMLVCKADFYSFNNSLARLLESYVDSFAVSSVEEGIVLRELDITKPILVLYTKVFEIEECIKYNFDINLYKEDDLIKANEICKEHNVILNLHLPINTGMNRIGANITELNKILPAIKKLNNINFNAVYTHFHTTTFSNIIGQYCKFKYAVNICEKYKENLITHYISSNYIYYNFDKITKNEFIRIGSANYLKTIKSTTNCFDLYSTIIEINDVKQGESIGYNSGYICNTSKTVAVCSGGYYDGIISSFTGQKVRINNNYCTIIGNVCMDVFFVDVTNIKCKLYDKVYIIDASDDNLSVSTVCSNMDISSHELLAGLKGRLKTIYQK